MKTSVNAYAKINLFLDIDSIRENGYHNIISYMQSVTLHDVVTVEYFPHETKEIIISCDSHLIPCNEQNLSYKAADIFPEYKKGKMLIEIQKNIPISAGLAGGSADAAATLTAINHIFGNTMTRDELKSLGAKLGADVPFCIEMGSCIATGIGEKIQKTTPMPNYPILIAKHGEGMSTPEAYKYLDDRFNKFKSYTPHTDKLDMLLSTEVNSVTKLSLGLFNIFEEIVEPKRPYVSLIKKIMNDNSAIYSMMSGSGTSVFGIFRNESDALSAKEKLNLNNIEAHLCHPLDV